MITNIKRVGIVLSVLVMFISGCGFQNRTENKVQKYLAKAGTVVPSYINDSRIPIGEFPYFQDWNKVSRELAKYDYSYSYDKKQNRLKVDLLFRDFKHPEKETGDFLSFAQRIYLLQRYLFQEIKKGKLLNRKILVYKFTIEVKRSLPGIWDLSVTSDYNTMQLPFEKWLTWSRINTSGSLG